MMQKREQSFSLQDLIQYPQNNDSVTKQTANSNYYKWFLLREDVQCSPKCVMVHSMCFLYMVFGSGADSLFYRKYFLLVCWGINKPKIFLITNLKTGELELPSARVKQLFQYNFYKQSWQISVSSFLKSEKNLFSQLGHPVKCLRLTTLPVKLIFIEVGITMIQLHRSRPRQKMVLLLKITPTRHRDIQLDSIFLIVYKFLISGFVNIFVFLKIQEMNVAVFWMLKTCTKGARAIAKCWCFCSKYQQQRGSPAYMVLRKLIVQLIQQKMSFYYLINQYSMATTISQSPSFFQQIVHLPSIYFLQTEMPFIQNLNPNIPTNQASLPIPPPQFLPATQQTERRPIIQHEWVQEKKVKKIRRKNVEKEIESAKKNSESNIINHLYSFFNTYEKSEIIVDRAIGMLGKAGSQVQKIRSIFYNTVRLMNYNRGRRYVNKQTIRNYYTPEKFKQHIPDIEEKLAQTALLTLEQLCFIFRVGTLHFVKNVSILSILSSKRISTVAKKQHLKRRRLIERSLLSNEENLW